ncbi:MAG: HlyD family secretion protein [Verrucomicrobiota bacterium]|nr:HlyD family secretion protein [Verrucomicrobiota bacterium]
MVLALGMLFGFAVFFWLVFFKFKWLKLSVPWVLVSAFFVVHVLLIFLIGLRFMTPASNNAKVVQHTIQLVPRLTEPALVTAVLVEPNQPVKKGQPLFLFDRRPYEYKVQQLEAQLAQAKQNVQILKADIDVADQKLAKTQSETVFAKYQQNLAASLAAKGAGPEEEAQRWDAQLKVNEAAVKETMAELDRAKLRYESQVNGVNTSVAEVEAELQQARYYLDHTTLVAPEDGRIVNLQVRPGMVAGDYRFGAIASFICDDGRYLLGAYFQEVLKYMTNGQPVEVALELYPGQIFQGKVQDIWRASGEGQYLPSGNLPVFHPEPPKVPQGCFAVAIVFDDPDQSKFPIGAQGVAAIYTKGMHGPWAALRRVSIRITSWMNWLYPMPF